jgi:twinkle protein
MQVFERDDGTVDGYCFSCNTYIRNPLGDVSLASAIPKENRIGKTKEEVDKELEDILSYPVVDLKVRKLRASYLEEFGVKVGVSEQDGKTPTIVYFPYTLDGNITGYKVRLLEEKRMWSIGSTKGCDLFGWEQAIKTGARRLIITEGEFDAVALRAIIDLETKDSYKDYKPAVVSLISGASSAKKDISRLMPKIKKYFKEVVLCFDNDEPGQKAVSEVCKLFGDVTSITLPCKDANECILQGTQTKKAAYAAVTFRASKPNNIRLIHGSQLRDKAKQAPKMGLSWPWEGLTKLTRGIRRGETYYFGAGV